MATGRRDYLDVVDLKSIRISVAEPFYFDTELFRGITDLDPENINIFTKQFFVKKNISPKSYLFFYL